MGGSEKQMLGQEERSKVTDAMLLPLMTEEGALSQGRRAASRSIERTQILPLECTERMVAP